MVVVCPECNTRFSLDTSRIPGPTAKVRCSRCRHVFQVDREGQVVKPAWTPPVEAVEDANPGQEFREEPPAPPEPPAPEPVRPLPPPPPPEPWEPAGEAAATATAALPAEPPPQPGKARRWVRLAVPLLAVVVVAGLGWLAWQGKLPNPLKPAANLVQRLKGKPPAPQPPAPVAGSPAGAPAAPTVATPPPPPAPAQDLTDLAVDWAQAHYQGMVNDKGGGQMLLIQGEIINRGKTPRGPIRIRATITDAQHKPWREEMVYAGTSLNDAEAKTLPPDDIKGWLTKPGGRSQEQVVKPGEKQPFTVVFFGVPNNLAETQSGFQLVVVEGPPVK